MPDEHIIDPWTTPLAFATEAVGNGVELAAGRVAGAGGRARPAMAMPCGSATATLRARCVVNAAGLRGDELHRGLGHDGFTVTPRRGELSCSTSSPARCSAARPARADGTTKGVLVAPTVFGNVMLGPTAEDIDDKTRDRLDRGRASTRLLATGAADPARLLDEEVTAIYAGLRAATEHGDYQIERPSRPALRVRRRHPLDRAHGVDGHRRGRARAARRRPGLPLRGEGRRPSSLAVRMPNLGEADPTPPYQAGRPRSSATASGSRRTR